MIRDDKYYEDPLTFDPTRWTKENVAARNPYLHMTFGKISLKLHNYLWTN